MDTMQKYGRALWVSGLVVAASFVGVVFASVPLVQWLSHGYAVYGVFIVLGVAAVGGYLAKKKS